jgi:DNA gyrase inhibitor GyrI
MEKKIEQIVNKLLESGEYENVLQGVTQEALEAFWKAVINSLDIKASELGSTSNVEFERAAKRAINKWITP